MEEWVEDVVHIYNGVLFNHKHEIMPFATIRMDPEIIYPTKWSWSDSKRQTSYDITCMWYFKKGYKWTCLQNRNRLRLWKQTYGYQRGQVWGDEQGVWDWPLHTEVYKERPANGGLLYIWHQEYYVIIYMGKNSEKRMDVYICITESLLYSRNYHNLENTILQ